MSLIPPLAKGARGICRSFKSISARCSHFCMRGNRMPGFKIPAPERTKVVGGTEAVKYACAAVATGSTAPNDSHIFWHIDGINGTRYNVISAVV